VPGEHDVFTDDGKRYLERFGKGAGGDRRDLGVSVGATYEPRP
jgi:hypothetical protein